ncbi:MAG: putative membrane protein (TIGR00267 family) [Alphaproteobacteria bacterium]|jgi:predicted membrane protein (TIGR00267 family)
MHLIRLSQSQSIIRRYFVVNGFDGALTMFGLILGFMLSIEIQVSSVINVCLGAAIALSVSGVSSAYVSERAERKFLLRKLEDAMLADLSHSTHASATRLIPVVVALVNGFAPLVISALIMLPLWLSEAGVLWVSAPLWSSLCIAGLLLFALGVVLSNVAGTLWYISGLKTLAIGCSTATLIYFIVGAR